MSHIDQFGVIHKIMGNHKFTCPHCNNTYEILNYNIGFADAIELRCDRCPATLWVGLYDKEMNNFRKIDKEGYTEYDVEGIMSSLNPCDCGGLFDYHAPYRCKECNKEVDLDELIRQINWKGAPDGRPGIAMERIIDGDKSEGAIWKKIV